MPESTGLTDLERWPWLGNLHDMVPPHWAGMLLVGTAIVCGLLVGAERELARKPAGLRTLALLCTGSCVFTLASLLVSAGWADPARIAAGIVTGVGFLGAGAIVRERGNVVGLTTGATIWTVAAIGVVVGAGYAAAGFVLSIVVVAMLVVVKELEQRMTRSCRFNYCRLLYRSDRGKTRIQILQVLDAFGIPDAAWKIVAEEESETEELQVRYCHYHADHRALLFDLVAIPGVREIQAKRSAREVEPVGLTESGTRSAA